MRKSSSPPKSAVPASPSRMAGLGSYTYSGTGQYRTSQTRVGPLSSYTSSTQQQQQQSQQQQPQPQARSYTSPKPPRANPVRPTTLQANALTSGPRAPSPVPFGTTTIDPDYCLCCPPNDLRFCDAVRAKQRAPLRRPANDKGGDSGSERDYIGFATLPEQVHRKSVKRGFEFTLMVVGESGLGKSTLVNSLFLSDLYKDRVIPDASERIARTTAIARQTMDIEERGVRLRLSVVDTPGFGDALDCEDSWRAVCSYVDQQFSQFFQDESGLHRKNIQDNRVHCCLYFVPPYGHGLRQLDVEFMRRLQNKVNLVPVVAKADTLTAPELKRLKQRILDDLEEQNIQIYQFPDCDSDEDEEFKKQDDELKKSVPFAVISSNTTLEVGGKRVRGRQYPWGVVEVDNPLHSDFARLRSFLISTHMQDLKDVTHDLHYEAFRAHCISQISQQAIRERTKLKRDSVSGQGGADIETDRLLLEKDEEIRRMQDMLAQMQQKLQKQSSQGSQGDGLNELSIPPSGNQRDSVVDV